MCAFLEQFIQIFEERFRNMYLWEEFGQIIGKFGFNEQNKRRFSDDVI